jgi:branched-chain amino acid transport system ATP-binding protein
VACYFRGGGGLGTFLDRDPRRREEMLERVFGLFPVLRQRAAQRAGTFSGGEGQMLSIAQALMSRPRFLMLDEPSLGIMSRIVDSILDVLQTPHRQEGLTVLLVEQNVPAASRPAGSSRRARAVPCWTAIWRDGPTWGCSRPLKKAHLRHLAEEVSSPIRTSRPCMRRAPAR